MFVLRLTPHSMMLCRMLRKTPQSRSSVVLALGLSLHNVGSQLIHGPYGMHLTMQALQFWREVGEMLGFC